MAEPDPLPFSPPCLLWQVRRGVPVLRVRKGVQTAAFLGPVAALMVLSNPSISPPLALLCMTAALGITSLGECGLDLVGCSRWGGVGGLVSLGAVERCQQTPRSGRCVGGGRPVQL